MVTTETGLRMTLAKGRSKYMKGSIKKKWSGFYKNRRIRFHGQIQIQIPTDILRITRLWFRSKRRIRYSNTETCKENRISKQLGRKQGWERLLGRDCKKFLVCFIRASSREDFWGPAGKIYNFCKSRWTNKEQFVLWSQHSGRTV
jgi:hypothetical protein